MIDRARLLLGKMLRSSTTILPYCPTCGARRSAAVRPVGGVSLWRCFACKDEGEWTGGNINAKPLGA